ncbi:MAG: hypothetical protein IJW31_08825 [Lentisphaeria bacterium]|nr:hypothetical protein [Lentisphaeria bacterium]
MHFLANLLGNNALALKEKVINPDGPLFIRLVGRKSGLVDWFLNLIGINTTTTLEVYEDRIEYSYGSLSGNVLELIPLSKVSNCVCGRFKPVILLFIALLCFFFAFVTFGLTLIITIICVIYYFLKKTTVITIIPNSASAAGVAFKRSIIENQSISDEEAKQIITLVASLVEKANA